MRACRSPLVVLGLSLLAQLACASAAEAEAAPESTPFDLGAAIASGPPMDAERAAARAAQSAPSIVRTRALVRAAEAVVLRTRDQLLPRLEVSARYAHVDGFPDGRIDLGSDPQALLAANMLAGQIQDPASRALWLAQLAQPRARILKIPRDQLGVAGRITWPVSDLFFQIAPAIEAARAGVRVSEAQHEARLARVRLDARESFYQLARARAVLAVAERAVEQARVQKERIDSAVRAGIRAAADASTAASRLAAAVQAVASAEASVDVADAALRTLLGDPEGPRYGIAEALFAREEGSTVAEVPLLLERARARRPELRALGESMRAQRKSARASDATGYPHLAVYAGADYARPNRYVIPPEAKFQPSWEAGVTLSYAPNDTLAARHRAREYDAQIEALSGDLAELDRGLVLEVRRARAGWVRAGQTIAAARAAERAAQDAYDNRLAELRAGEVTIADLFAAESELNRARLEAIDAAIEERLAGARLAYATGE